MTINEQEIPKALADLMKAAKAEIKRTVPNPVGMQR
jgi:hypothetical protein